MKKPTAAAIYCRLSEDKNDDRKAVQRQEKECRALAERKGWPVVEVYVDNDVSASDRRRGRPQYDRMMRDAENGDIDAIICWHTDRLTRQPRQLEDVIDLADRHGVALATVQGDIDLGTPNGRAMARVIGAMSRQEVEQKSLRQKAKNLQSVAEGRPLSGPRAFGFEQDGVTEHVPEAQAIRDATKRIIEGGSLASIMRDWNEAGLRTTRMKKAGPGEPADARGYLLDADGKRVGGAWGYPSLTNALTRWRNAGIAQHLGQPASDQPTFEPLVSKEDLLAVREILFDPARRTNKDTALKHLLSGIITCGKCGSKMRWGRTTVGGRNYESYVCRGEAPRCRAGVLKDIAESAVTGRVASMIAFPDLTLRLMTSDDSGEIADARRGLARLTEEEAQVRAAEISMTSKLKLLEDFERQRRELDGRLRRTVQRNALASLLSDLSETTCLDDRLAAREEIREKFEGLDLDHKRTVIRALLRVEVAPTPPGVRPTRATAAKRIRMTTLIPGTDEPHPDDAYDDEA